MSWLAWLDRPSRRSRRVVLLGLSGSARLVLSVVILLAPARRRRKKTTPSV